MTSALGELETAINTFSTEVTSYMKENEKEANKASEVSTTITGNDSGFKAVEAEMLLAKSIRIVDFWTDVLMPLWRSCIARK